MHHDEINRLLSLLHTDKNFALESLYREFSIPFYTLIIRTTGDKAMSEDILHDFFVKLSLNPPAGPLRNPKSYLYRMLRNLTIDTLRSQKTTVPLDDSLPCGEDLSASAAERLDLDHAIGTLSQVEREILSLHINSGLTFREVSEITEIPLGTVLWKHQQILRKLRTILNGANQ